VLLTSGMTKGDEQITIKQEMQAASIGFFGLQRDENVQVNGLMFLFDMTGVGAKQMSRFASPDMRKWHSFWQVSLIILYTSIESRTKCHGTKTTLDKMSQRKNNPRQNAIVLFCVRKMLIGSRILGTTHKFYRLLT